MTTSALPILSASRLAGQPAGHQAAEHQVNALRPNPFLHFGPDRVYDPLTDRTMMQEEPGFASLIAIHAGASAEAVPELDRLRLLAEGWLLPEAVDPSSGILHKDAALDARNGSTHR